MFGKKAATSPFVPKTMSMKRKLGIVGIIILGLFIILNLASQHSAEQEIQRLEEQEAQKLAEQEAQKLKQAQELKQNAQKYGIDTTGMSAPEIQDAIRIEEASESERVYYILKTEIEAMESDPNYARSITTWKKLTNLCEQFDLTQMEYELENKWQRVWGLEVLTWYVADGSLQSALFEFNRCIATLDIDGGPDYVDPDDRYEWTGFDDPDGFMVYSFNDDGFVSLFDLDLDLDWDWDEQRKNELANKRVYYILKTVVGEMESDPNYARSATTWTQLTDLCEQFDQSQKWTAAVEDKWFRVFGLNILTSMVVEGSSLRAVYEFEDCFLALGFE